MKKCICLMFALELLLSLTFSFTAFASFDTSNARFVDNANNCDEASEKKINAMIDWNMKRYKIDIAILTEDDIPKNTDYADYAKKYYNEKNYGYGITKDGVLLIVDYGNKLFDISCYGNAKKRLNEIRKSRIEEKYKNDTKTGGVKTYDELFINFINNVSYELSKTKADTMPYWYPDSTEDFEAFHGENLPLVVDDADILSDEQESLLKEKIKEITEKHSIGYVLFTDIDNHGKTFGKYADEFLRFNGYGDSAAVFYISLEPENTGFKTAFTNSCEEYFTSHVIGQIKGEVENDVKSGRYYEAALKHIDFVDKLYSGEIEKEYDSTADEISAILLSILFITPILSVIGGIGFYKKQKKSMCVIPPEEALDYVVPGSYKFMGKRNYDYTTVYIKLKNGGMLSIKKPKK